MAEFESDTYTAQNTAAGRADKIIADAALVSGGGHCLQMQATIPAATATGDTILLGFLPAGLTVKTGSCIHASAAGGNTIDLGFATTTEEPNARTALAAAVPTAAGIALINPSAASYKNGSRRPVVATLNGALAAGAVINVSLACVRAE